MDGKGGGSKRSEWEGIGQVCQECVGRHSGITRGHKARGSREATGSITSERYNMDLFLTPYALPCTLLAKVAFKTEV